VLAVSDANAVNPITPTTNVDSGGVDPPTPGAG
jgi:hypothetical protein